MKLPENYSDNYPFTIYDLLLIDLFAQTIKPPDSYLDNSINLINSINSTNKLN